MGVIQDGVPWPYPYSKPFGREVSLDGEQNGLKLFRENSRLVGPGDMRININ